MHKRSLFNVAGLALATSLVLSGCGGNSRSDSAADGGDKVVKIGVIAPLSGDLSALGLGIKNATDLAIKKANDSGQMNGWTIQLAAEDDQASPDVGKNAATKLAADDAVAGVVGSLTSSVAQTVQPVLSAANIIMVSPSNTAPGLSQGADLSNPTRPYPNYFRTATTDAIQGPFAAKYVYETLKVRKVAVIHDKKAYGQGLATAFADEFKKLGGTIVSLETINPDDKNFSSVISKVKPSKPELVYYGGEYPQAGPLSQQMKGQGLSVPLMGGDGFYSADYIKLATAKSAEGDMATAVGAPVDKLESAKQFVADYNAAGYKETYEAYGAYGYDAATAIIEALKVCLADATTVKDARAKCVEAENSVKFDGATGTVSFDKFGDTTSKILTVYKVANGAWVAEKTGAFDE